MGDTLLSVEHFKIGFEQYVHGLERRKLEMVHDVTLQVKRGEILSVIGASGSGKSLLAHAVLGILPSNAYTEGTMWFDGQVLDDALRKKVRGRRISLIPQSVSYLDPMQRVEKQVEVPRKRRKGVASALLKRFELDETTGRKYPFELSGGMARRVLISTALAAGAELVIADEPTPGIHTSVIEETIKSFRSITEQGGAVLMITHDISMAFQVSDRVAVFNNGWVVSVEETEHFLKYPGRLKSPYSRALWNALPEHGFYAEVGKRYTPEMEDVEHTLQAIKQFEEGEHVVKSRASVLSI